MKSRKPLWWILGVVIVTPIVVTAVAFGLPSLKGKIQQDQHSKQAQAMAPCLSGAGWSQLEYTPPGNAAWAVDTGGQTYAGYSAFNDGTNPRAVATTLNQCLTEHGFTMSDPTDETVNSFNRNPTAHPGAPAATPAPGDTWQITGRSSTNDIGGSVQLRRTGTLLVNLSMSFKN